MVGLLHPFLIISANNYLTPPRKLFDFVVSIEISSKGGQVTIWSGQESVKAGVIYCAKNVTILYKMWAHHQQCICHDNTYCFPQCALLPTYTARETNSALALLVF